MRKPRRWRRPIGRGDGAGAERVGHEMNRLAFWILASANFAVALGYGAILPLLPTMLGEVVGVATPAAVAWHTGVLLGSYMLGLFATAPLWGAVADRVGGRRLLLFGLCGYAAALVAFALSGSLAGAFEAMLPAIGPDALSLDPPALGVLLALCMVAMLAVQGGLFLVPLLHRVAHGPFLAAGFLVVAGGVALLGQAGSLAGAALAVGLIGAGGAFLQPAIAYLATLNDAGASGTLLGALTGAGSLGQALGSIAGGALFAVLGADGLWVVAAGLTAGAAWFGVPARSGGARVRVPPGTRREARITDDLR
jgi:predicted MFS family arabinose efflux permease